MIREPKEILNSDIWEKSPNSRSQVAKQIRRVIVVGEQAVGKTSLIKSLRGDLDYETKSTRFPDYFCTKKQGLQIEMYEVTIPRFFSMIDAYLIPQKCSSTFIFYCVDLSKPQNFATNLSTSLDQIYEICKRTVKVKQLDKAQRYLEWRARNYNSLTNHQDVESIRKMPFSMTVVGCKYDLFEKTPDEERKWICRCLRYISHINGANLTFSSNRNLQWQTEMIGFLIERTLQGVKEDLTHKEGSSKGRLPSRVSKEGLSNTKNHNKPLLILAGEDKICEMSLPSFNNSGAFNELKVLQQQLESVFPSKKVIESPPNRKSWNPIGLDSLIAREQRDISKAIQQRKTLQKSGGNKLSLISDKQNLQESQELDRNQYGKEEENYKQNVGKFRESQQQQESKDQQGQG